jgi:large subunit ribosomal protein L18
MSNLVKHKRDISARRARRSRARIHGTATRPRLSVKRSLRHVYAQLIDDDAMHTLVSASDKEVDTKGKPVEIAKSVGLILGKKATDAGIAEAVFDRGSYRYHGRVAALAQGAREAGLKF